MGMRSVAGTVEMVLAVVIDQQFRPLLPLAAKHAVMKEHLMELSDNRLQGSSQIRGVPHM